MLHKVKMVVRILNTKSYTFSCYFHSHPEIIVSCCLGKEEDFNAWVEVLTTYLETKATQEKESCCQLKSEKSTNCECQNGVLETQVRKIKLQ